MIRKCVYCHKKIKVMDFGNRKGLKFEPNLHSIFPEDGFVFGKDCVYLSDGTKIFGTLGYSMKKPMKHGWIKHKCIKNKEV